MKFGSNASRLCKLPATSRDLDQEISAPVMAQVQHDLSCSSKGSAATVRRQLRSLVESFKPSERIVTGTINGHAARVKSFEIEADVLVDLVESSIAA